MQLSQQNDHYSEAHLDAGSKMSSISEILDPDDSFLSVPREVVDSSQTVPQINSQSFARRENCTTNVDLPPVGQRLEQKEIKRFFRSALNTFEDTCKLEEVTHVYSSYYYYYAAINMKIL